MKERIKRFSKKIGSGLKQEYIETKQIPYHLKKGNIKEAAKQFGDIGKMVFIAFVWFFLSGIKISKRMFVSKNILLIF